MMRHYNSLLFVSLLCLLAGAAACSEVGTGPVRTEKVPVRLVTVANGLEQPWGMAFLPDGRLLVSERPGRLRIVAIDGTVAEPLAGVPPVDAVGQGGLLDVQLDPDYVSNGWVYLSYTEPREGGNGTTVARGRLTPAGLDSVEVIFRHRPTIDGKHHFGSRLIFARDGNLFVTLGDRNSERDGAQDLGSHLGKVVRIRPDGSVPDTNPFVNTPGALPEIWSYGHRNVQGAAVHPATGELWTNEHGPKGGDEFNRTLAGRNYGWPVITFGKEYSGKVISEETEKPGMEQPAHYWVPSIATSGLIFYTGAAFPAWQGNALIGGLAGQQVSRLELEGNEVVHEEVLLKGVIKARVRDIEQGPDGLVYLLTGENRGQLLRLEPVD